MPGPGKRFEKGHDPRRNTTGGSHGKRSKTMRQLAQAERENTVATFRQLRDQAEDERVRLEAAKILAAYSDGKPRDTAEQDEAPTEEEQPPAEVAALFALPPPEEQT